MRVAFIFPRLGNEWLGGVNYFRSLFQALALQDSHGIKPVLIIPPASRKEASVNFPGVEIVCSHLMRRGSFAHCLRKFIEYANGRDWLLEGLLRREHISISSHGPALDGIPSLSWFPDFQHLHLPQFFSKKEIRKRNQQMLRVGMRCTQMIVSSHCARDDVARFMPQILPKVRVLHFAPSITSEAMLPIEALGKKYGFSGKYVFLPNQYWAHKNHLTVISALQLLKNQGQKVQVISTGATVDYRNLDHFKNVLQEIETAGIGELYKILGVIPYHDMASLMYHSHAVINPSLFEGWSTTVEEAKILGKQLLLSDIPVHREQAGEQAVYFSPQSASECARAIEILWGRNAVPACLNYRENAKIASQNFGKEYGLILAETMGIRQRQ